MLNNYGAHYVDQLLYLSGSPAEQIVCKRFKAVSLGDAEDVVKVLITVKSGVLLDLDISQAAPLPVPAMTLWGTRGAASLEKDGAG